MWLIIGALAALLLLASCFANRRAMAPTTVIAALLALQFVGFRGSDNSAPANSAALLFAGVLLLLAIPPAVTSPRRLIQAWRDSDASLWAAFLLLGVIGLNWSANPEYGAHKLAMFAAYGVAPGYVAVLIGQRNPSMRWLDVVVAGTCYCIIVLAFGSSDSGRLSAAGSNPIWVGRTAAVTLLVVSVARGWPLLIRAACILVSAAVLLLANSRGPALGVALAPALVSVIRRIQTGTVRWVPTLLYTLGIAACLTGYALLTTGESIESAGWPRAATLLSPSQLRRDENVAGRIERQAEALAAFASEPVLGTGLGAAGAPGERRYPHNLLLEIASEMGAIGIGVFLLLIVRAYTAAENSFLIQALLVVSVLFALTSGDLGFNNYIPLLAMTGYGIRVRHATPTGT